MTDLVSLFIDVAGSAPPGTIPTLIGMCCGCSFLYCLWINVWSPLLDTDTDTDTAAAAAAADGPFQKKNKKKATFRRKPR